MKSILIIFFSIFPFCPLCAQNWSNSVMKGDDLKGTEDCVVQTFVSSDKKYSFSYWSTNENTFRIQILNGDFFNYATRYGSNGHHIILGLVGFYDQSNKLLEKIEDFCLELDDEGTPNCAHPNRYTKMGKNNNKLARKILDYINKSKGYVRFVYELYGGKELDFRVKCKES